MIDSTDPVDTEEIYHTEEIERPLHIQGLICSDSNTDFNVFWSVPLQPLLRME